MPEPQPRDTLSDFADHLEFFGYKTERDDTGIDATHGTQPYVRFFPHADGLLFQSPFDVNSNAKSDTAGFAEFLNKVNADVASVARFYYAEDTMWVEAWFPDIYDKKRFGAFFGQFLEEIMMPRSVVPDGVTKYLTKLKE